MCHEEHDRQAEAQIKRDVKEYGWHVGAIEANTATPAFAYTIGLWENFKQPEIICFGLPTKTLHLILNDAGEWIRGGKTIELAVDNFDILEAVPVQFRQVEEENIADYFGYGRWFYDYKDFPAIQLIWPDRDKNYPWNENYDEQYEFAQPMLDRKLDFKFFEPRNTTAFVARQIFEESMPILRVFHDDDDGAWQFLTGELGELVTSDDIMIVCLEDVVKHDPTINELFNMPTGRVATREFVGAKWIREEIEEEEETE
ncbi:hypothetical protein SAMN00120144_1884 [Hymenobacter roseosalivarius DSM 11622]|uniref:DUF4262 domain-containing protein n=1 Tax=Hymenobacter roseosalivarius DSM 11622 TaxID=645990 RepID=A0A1W1VPA8_9BACT|nr:DUF4262 domain-containing protein [Hymenobacter roseosalivarius]SMB95188.1 hypothetical protein SAMN00120144_1884 [Hymenobacter roseosalivarius DSM 11622]